MKAAAELAGDLGYRQAVQVAQRQRRALVGGKTGKGGVRSRDVELCLPRVVHRLGASHDPAEPAALEVRSPPVVDQLVAGDAHQPGDSELRRESRLAAATAAMNVSAVRSSASTALPHRGRRYRQTWGRAR